MGALDRLRSLFVGIGAAALGGCLVSDEPVLDASSGNETPLKSGDYLVCSLDEGPDGSDCEITTVVFDNTGLYSFIDPDGLEAPAEMRFRRIGRRGYAVQSYENDVYMYYYGKGNSRRFRLTLMMCDQLTEDLRADLIDDGDLAADDEDFVSCTVNTLRGLTAPAKAYHRGVVDGGESLEMELTPAPPESVTNE